MTTSPTYQRSVVWLRRALRVQDNLPLWTALRESREIVPVVFLSNDPRYADTGPRHRFILAALQDLRRNLEDLGSGLVVRDGPAVTELPRLAAELGAGAVYAVDVFDRETRKRDDRIREALRAAGIAWLTLPDTLLRQPGELLNGAGLPYRVFTPFKRAWLAGADGIPRSLPKIRALPPLPGRIRRGSIPGREGGGPGGETAALRRWRRFLGGPILDYATARDLPGADGTSKISAYLAHGAISVRRLYHDALGVRREATGKGKSGIDTFISELVWREFYYHITFFFPHVVERAFRDEMADLEWTGSDRVFAAWAEGRTGYPIVDAALRQLRQEGWVHNRARMIAASFLTKDLQIDWRRGERLFLELLADADIASNNGGWQWTAGTGTDASPWFRIFNPVTQGKRFDPSGDYVRRYVPELAAVPDRYVHSPWLMPEPVQRLTGVLVGRDYPAPIVDHGEARLRTLALYRGKKPPGSARGENR